MASINQYKNIIEELNSRIDLLKKAIELDPANTISYQTAIEHCQSQIDAAKWIAEADKVVNQPKAKKDDKDAKESKPKKSTAKKSTSKKSEPKVEEPKTDNAPAEPTAEDDVFDLFGD